MGREEWAKRVERWKDSGLTAKEFAAELGINANSLQQWAYQLKKGPARAKREPTLHEPAPQFVEVTPAIATAQSFEVRVGRFSIGVPGGFDESSLVRLLRVLEHAQ